MPADVNEVRGDGAGYMDVLPIGKVDGYAILSRQIEDGGYQPCRVAKLNDTPDFQLRGMRFEGGEKDFEPFQIYVEAGWQLKEHRAQAVFQMFCVRKEEGEWLFRILQLFDVRQKAACFDGKDEL